MVQPRIQLRLIAAFASVSTLALLLQHLLFMNVLAELAVGLPQDGAIVMDELNGVLWRTLLGAFGLLLPVMFLVGVVATQRWAGPLYRFHLYLRQVADGERPPDCRLRTGDELQQLCDLINAATRPARQPESPAATASPAPSPARPRDPLPGAPPAPGAGEVPREAA